MKRSKLILILSPPPKEKTMDKLELAQLIEERSKRNLYNKINTYFPPSPHPLSRDKYHKHMEFFQAGTAHRQRLMLAANRIGKTESVGGYEMTLHLTGLYPSWWMGKRFHKPTDWWAAGDTGKTVRDILQFKLLGPMGQWGTGLIPKHLIDRTTRSTGIADAVDTLYVKHTSGGTSQVSFKSYDQKRTAFQGTEKDGIWLDEEPPLEVYTECLMRTMTNNGIIMATFTPLTGMSEVVLSFLPEGQLEDQEPTNSKYVVMASWDDVPHLSDEVKKELWDSLPPFQRDARSKGIPQLGSGAIFPVPESDIVCDDFSIPDYWPRSYGMDVGWNRTAVVWAASDIETNTHYIYSEYYRSQAEPSVHAHAISSRGKWIPGAIDPASRGRSQADGLALINQYQDLGLNLQTAHNGVESGLYQVWQMLSSGKLKIFKSCLNWTKEYRLYRRDEKGRVVKQNDHLMDATRYLVVSGLGRAIVKPVKEDYNFHPFITYGEGSWMH